MALAETSRAPIENPRLPIAGARLSTRAFTTALGAVAALICIAPALAVIVLALTRQGETQVASALIRDAAFGTLGLVAVGGGLAIVLGAAAAWLVTLCKFPGRASFEWLLALPLAAPLYVLAYAYTGMTWAGGPFDAFPVRGFWGAAFVYALGAYPYVYLAARAAYASGSVCALEAARTLGAKPLDLFVRVAAPLAWPGIAAGGALAAMEIAADYGAAQHFGVTTIGTAVFRTWYDYSAPDIALKLAALLIVAAVIFLVIERRARGRRGYAGGSARWRPLPRYALPDWARWSAFAFCAALVTLGALAPLAWFARLALFGPAIDVGALSAALRNSLLLAAGGAAATLVLAFAIAAAGRDKGLIGRAALFAANAGYAAPGAVIALGAISLFAFAREAGWIGGLGATLSVAALIWAYATRFAAAGAQPIEAGLARLSQGIDNAARTLGASPAKRLLRVDLPIALPSVAAAALIVFVEILKELPATLILRPFNFDTLAVHAYAYASDERLHQAGAPALLITLAGAIPILLLTRAMTRARAGSR